MIRSAAPPRLERGKADGGCFFERDRTVQDDFGVRGLRLRGELPEYVKVVEVRLLPFHACEVGEVQKWREEYHEPFNGRASGWP